jgi:hypothetical protein
VSSIAAADVDKDGKTDIITGDAAGNTQTQLNFFRNISTVGAVSFATDLSYAISTGGVAAIAMGDMNGDGLPDVVVVMNGGGLVYIFQNSSTQGNISIIGPTQLTLIGTAVSVAVDDIDGDGKPDIVLGSVSTNFSIAVFQNTSTAAGISFTELYPNYYIAANTINQVAIADLDGDGRPDIESSDVTGNVYIYHSESSPGILSWDQPTLFSPNTGIIGGPNNLTINDLNGDGTPDLATVVNTTPVVVFRNNLAAPGVTSFSPATGRPGDTITIKGIHLAAVDTVRFGGTIASSFTVVSDTVIKAVVDTGSSGVIYVSSIYGSDSLSGFTFLNPPVITSFSPTAQVPDSLVTIHGRKFTGATSVTFGGTPALSFTVVSDSVIKATVGYGVSGKVYVIAAHGTDSLGGFTFLAAPVITSFSPTAGDTLTSVSISGHDFTGTIQVSFGGTPALSFTVVSDSTITAVVGDGASGAVTVTNVYGTGSLSGFAYIYNPVITSFTPTTQYYDSLVTIHGQKFTGATAVSFGGTPALSFTVVSDSVITAIVGAGTSGAVSVTTIYSSGSLGGFTYVNQAPTITSISPASFGPGQRVIVKGANLINIESVNFGNSQPNFFQQTPDSLVIELSTYIPVANSITITTPGGTAVDSNFTFLVPPPHLYYFTPTAASAGTQVTIYGYYLVNVTGVSFGGVPAAAYSVSGDSAIFATLGAGASGNVVVSMQAGSDTLSGFTYIYGPPSINTFWPDSATLGSNVIITGRNLSGATAVSFGGTPAASFTVIGADSITAVVGAGKSGDVVVTTPGGSDTTGIFTYTTPLVSNIASFAPVTAAINTIVTITGTNFTDATAVLFGGTPALSFTIVNADTITARVGPSASGDVSVVTPGGTDSLAGFTFIPSPTITSIAPTSFSYGSTVTITGTNLTGVTSVTFGPIPATSFTVVSPTTITAVVPYGASSGFVSVENAGGTASTSYTITSSAPTITSFTPDTATYGNTVTITGTNFTGTTAVYFGQAPAASFTVVSPTTIAAVLAPSYSGDVEVQTPGGSATASGFTYTPAIQIDSITPGAGATVLIKGYGFTGTTVVAIGGVPATSFTVLSDNTISAVLGGAATGKVAVEAPQGLVYFRLPASAINSFTPTSATSGSVVTITGANFLGTTAVSFGGTPAASFSVVSLTTIIATVGSGTSGNVVVTMIGGSDTLGGFTYITPQPTITSFTPTSAPTDSTVTITGTNFTGATGVSFGGTPAASFTVVSATAITAVIGAGTSGNVSVTKAGGTATLGGFTYDAPPAPAITSFTPVSGGTGTEVTITGTNFTEINSVSFDGTAAASFSILSPTSIEAIVGTGATGAVTVNSSNGTAALPGFTYLQPFVLLQFTGALVNNQAQLKWQTQNEQRISNYVIERSQDSLTFTAIGTQQPQHTGSGVNSYAFTDPNLQAGKNYYQLQITDTSGNAVSGGVVEVSLPGSNNAVTLYPNPAKGVVNITVPSSANTATLQVVDLHGNVFATIAVAPNTSQVTVDFTGATTGFYILSWTDGTRKLVKKIMVIN